MQKPAKYFLIAALLLSFCAYAGLRGARGEQGAAAPVVRSREVISRDGAGPLVLKDWTLVSAGGSSILKGEVLNGANVSLDGATLEVKAYDREGNILRGTEEKTLLRVGRLEAGARSAINSGYGVWLQGIPKEAVASVEITEADDAQQFPARAIPLADHALFWKEYSEIEE